MVNNKFELLKIDLELNEEGAIKVTDPNGDELSKSYEKEIPKDDPLVVINKYKFFKYKEYAAIKLGIEMKDKKKYLMWAAPHNFGYF